MKHENLVLSEELIRVDLPPSKIWKADVWSVSPSSGRIEELWVVVGFYEGVKQQQTTHNSSIRSDEGLTLETSDFQTWCGGNWTLSIRLANENLSEVLVCVFLKRQTFSWNLLFANKEPNLRPLAHASRYFERRAFFFVYMKQICVHTKKWLIDPVFVEVLSWTDLFWLLSNGIGRLVRTPPCTAT